MGITDRYKKSLEARGIKVDIQPYAPKKDRGRLIAAAFGIIVAIPSYIALYWGYGSCVSSAGSGIAGSTYVVSSSFVFNCQTDLGLYSVVAGLFIFVTSLLVLKALRGR